MSRFVRGLVAASVLVVLPNTPTGPMQLRVVGQIDAFADVVTELLVNGRGSSASAALYAAGVGRPFG